MRALSYLLAMLLSAATTATAAQASLQSRCEALSAHGPPGTVQITATLVAPGFALPRINGHMPPGILHFGATANDDSVQADAPVSRAFCRVQGIAPTAIRFEVWLPAEGWNGRLLGTGNGAMLGAILYPVIAAGIEAGYATVASDLGHEGGVTDARFAVGHPELLVDWGHRATHVMTVEARRLVIAFYGKPPAFSYFAGCSGGGRQAMMEAQRYPDDYDGILAGDPIMNFTRLTIAGRLWAQLAMFRESDGAGYIPATKIPAIAAAVIAACDKLDGVADGIISDPRACRFDPAAIQCRASDGPDCLTAPQVAALREIYRGAHDSRGRALFPGYSPGGEVGPNGWSGNLSGEGPQKNLQWGYAQGVLPALLHGDPSWDIRQLNYDVDVDRALALPILGQPMGEVIDAYDPDLSRFAAHGGKVIHYHGWSDAGVPPLSSVAYYQTVVDRIAATQKLAPAQALARTRDFYRLFMAPGMQHCSGGPGPDHFDGLTALRDWVEQKRPPTAIVASHIADGHVVTSRPLCPFPQTAQWDGKGNVAVAASFACRNPATPPHPNETG